MQSLCKGFKSLVNFYRVVERVSILFDVDDEYITRKGRQKHRVMARDLLCYWSVIELGMPMVDLAGKLDIIPGSVCYAVQLGEKTAKEGDYKLDSQFVGLLMVVPFFPLKLSPVVNLACQTKPWLKKRPPSSRLRRTDFALSGKI